MVSAFVAVAIAAASVAATPSANQRFRTTMFAAHGGQGTLLRTASEMSLEELAQVGFLNGELPDAQSTRPRARQQFFLLTGLIVLATTWAAAGRRLASVGGRRWPWAIALPAITIASMYLGAAPVLWAAAFGSMPLARWWSAKQPSARLP